MASVVGDRLRLVVKVLGSLVADEVGQAARLRRRTRQGEAGAAEGGAGADERRAKAVRHALESLGPFYVKLGQILSTRPDMVPQSIRDELQNLHDEVDVQPFSVFEPVLAGDLGPDWKLRFDDIDTVAPLGAASLAQVYRVTLPGGRPAVVKIQRPGIREGVLADMALMRRASRIVARVAPRFNEVIDVEAMLGSVFDAMEPELDFTGEARNMDEAREYVRSFRTLEVPRVLHASPGSWSSRWPRGSRYGTSTAPTSATTSASRSARTCCGSCTTGTSCTASSMPTRTRATSSPCPGDPRRSSTGAWSAGWTAVRVCNCCRCS